MRRSTISRPPEHPDQVDRIASERVGAGDIDAVIVDDEVVAQFFRARRRSQSRHHPA